MNANVRHATHATQYIGALSKNSFLLLKICKITCVYISSDLSDQHGNKIAHTEKGCCKCRSTHAHKKFLTCSRYRNVCGLVKADRQSTLNLKFAIPISFV